ncbi:hypothetical protein H4S02_005541, partial [Coemansia sp. RSA 2611]
MTPDVADTGEPPAAPSTFPHSRQTTDSCRCAGIKSFRVTEASPVPPCPCSEKCAGPDYG